MTVKLFINFIVYDKYYPMRSNPKRRTDTASSREKMKALYK